MSKIFLTLSLFFIIDIFIIFIGIIFNIECIQAHSLVLKIITIIISILLVLCAYFGDGL